MAQSSLAGCITPTARLRQRVHARRLARCHVMVSANMLNLSQATKAIAFLTWLEYRYFGETFAGQRAK
ncbi:MAG: hypothetical protein HC800_21560 [Phormidesmis sp. RL_2_1]|nr:hypothetical protein [Phormidesmis sp. RL_2_1]